MHNPVDKTNGSTQPCVDALRHLPTELEPPFNWQEFQRRAELNEADSDGVNWKHMAVAAAVLLVICGVAVWGRIGSAGRPQPTTAARSVEDSGIRGAAGDIDALRELQWGWGDGLPPANSSDDPARDVALAVSRSRAIDSWLATLPREPIVVRVGTRADIARLEDRIAQVDDLLTSVRLETRQPERLAALQRERVRLVGSLAQVRYAEMLASESP